jgi:putative Mn2+ efflux pump MntP
LGGRPSPALEALILGGFILPLGLDTFALATALGVAGMPPAARLRVTGLFTAFEMAMPLVGLFLGQALGAVLGHVAEYAAIALLAALGVYLLWPKGEEKEAERLERLARAHGVATLGLGLSISLDELAIGFTLGLLHQPLVLVVALVGLQALIVTQVGLRLGRRVGDRVREAAEQLAGGILLGLAVVVLVEMIVR